jgi:tRNA(fMet)-specific endonuclease VapC
MNYFLDTNILVLYLREHPLVKNLREIFHLEVNPNELFTSVICIGELKSLAIQNKWSLKRTLAIDGLRNFMIIVDELEESVLERYAEIDAFSQGRLEGKPLAGSSRNMGKNDLWIAATASVLHATLITTDKDFQHLHTQFLEVAYFDLNKTDNTENTEK